VTSPSIILLDVNMPDQNSHQPCRCIRSGYAHIQCPIVFFTGNNITDHLPIALEASGDYFVIKLFSAIILVGAVKRGFMAWWKKLRT
jgi:DNA-binding response OmpR family regulator